MDDITAELARRLAALESRVGDLYLLLDVVAPSPAESVARSLPDRVVALARQGRRDEAIRALLVDGGVSVADATARVTAYLRSIGR